MASNPDENNPPQNNSRKTNRGPGLFRRFGANRNTGPKQRPVSVLIPQPSSSSPVPNPPHNSNTDSGFSTATGSTSSSSSSTEQRPLQKTASFRINKKSGPYSGWQLYFSEIGN